MNKNIKKMMAHYLLAPALLSVWMCSLANATQYYVSNASPLGSDTACNGTANVPATSAPNCAFLTITKAANTAKAGDTVAIANGTYNENVNLAASGTASSRITFTGTTSAVVTSTAPVVSTTNPITGPATVATPIITGGLNFSGSYITVQGVTISTSGALGVPIYNSVSLGGSYNTINNSVIVATLNASVVAGTMTQVALASLQYTAIGIGGSFNTFSNSSILNLNDVDAIHVFGNDHKILHNLVNNVNEVNYAQNHTDFIQTWGTSSTGTSYNILVDSNTVTNGTMQVGNLETDGVPGVHDWTFRNNVFANVSNALFSGVPNTHFYNNLFYQVGANQGYALSLYNGGNYSSEGDILKNNAFVINTAVAGLYSPGWGYNGAASSVITIANNFYATTTNTQLPAGNNQVIESTAINGGNPAFANPAANNFTLQAGSVLIGKGLNLSSAFTNDLAGNTRTATWDVGAYAYNTMLLPPSSLVVY